MTNHKKQKLAILATLVVVFVSSISVSFAIIFSRPDANCVYVKVVSNGVDATFGAEFKACDGKAVVKYFDEDKRNSILQFEECEGNTQKSFTSANGTFLSEKCPYVMFKYYIKSNVKYNGSRAGRGIKVELADNSTSKNISIKYRVTTEEIEELVYDEIEAELYSNVPRTAYIAPGQTIYYYVIVERQGDDADYFCGQGDNLTWTLEKTDSYEENGWIVDKDNVVTAYVGEESEVVVPWTANAIAQSAFAGNARLKTVFIPSTITNVGDNAFAGCENLVSVQFERGYNNNALLYINSSTTIGAAAFKDCPLLESVILPKDVGYLAQSTFEECSLLQSIYLPDSLAGIGAYAFKGCEMLEEIVIPSGAADDLSIGIFEGCISLEKVFFALGTTSFDSDLFAGLDNLSGITYIKDGFVYIFHAGSGVVNVADIDSNSVEEGYFAGNTQLQSVTIPSNVIVIADGAFENCANLQCVTMLGEVETIGSSAFKNCLNLAQIELSYPQMLLGIGSEAFADSGLESFCFENEQITIADDAFYDCDNLTFISIQMFEQESIDSGALVTNANKALFDSCDNLDRIQINILFGDDEKDRGYYTFCGGFDGIELTYTFDFLINPYFAFSETIVEASIPTQYDVYDYYLNREAFRECHNLEKVVLPYKVCYVGEAAFYGCDKLKIMRLSNWVRVILPNAFYGCSALEYIYLPNTLTTIMSHAFAECSSLVQIILPESLITIEEFAFSGCTALEYVEMPANIEHLAPNIFENCDSLETIIIIDKE